MELNRGQQTAYDDFITWYRNTNDRTFGLTGYAGTGKTYLLAQIIDYLKQKGIQHAVVAPTGKAATVLRTKGIQAVTIHKLIYMPVETKDGSLRFERKDEEDLEEIDIIIADEATMINQEVYYELMSLGKRVLFSGDIAQLPPVEIDDTINFNVFETITINARLTEIMRQIGDTNMIPTIAAKLRNKQKLKVARYGNVVVMYKSSFTNEKLIDLYKRADQVLCGRNATRDKINQQLKVDKTTALITEGDKVIALTNNDQIMIDSSGDIAICNGVVGICKGLGTEINTFDLNIGFIDFQADISEGHIAPRIPFSLRDNETGLIKHKINDKFYRTPAGVYKKFNKQVAKKQGITESDAIKINQFDLAYAISVHKAQGSEWDNVVVIDESYCFGDKRYNWLYTAVTRARKNLIILI